MTEKGKTGGSLTPGRENSSSSLESLLQQALLQSQRPKLQRRSLSAPVVDVSAEKRGRSLSPHRASHVDGLRGSYFHKSRLEVSSSNFLERFAPPKLETISKKTDVPWSSSSGVLGSGRAALGVNYYASQDSRSSTFSTGDSLSSDTQPSATEGIFDAVHFEGNSSGSGDLAGQTESMTRFIDDILSNEDLDEEKSLMQQSGAFHAMVKEIAGVLAPDSSVDGIDDPVVVEADYLNDWAYAAFFSTDELRMAEKSRSCQAMAREIAGVLSPEANIPDIGEVEGFNDQNNNISEFIPTEDNTTMKLMEGYTCMLSKHITDVSGARNSDNVDYRSFITESDSLMVHFDDVFRYHLDNSNRKPTMKSDFDFNPLLRGLGGSNSSPPCATLTELLYRCAFAVSQGKTHSATEYLAELRSLSSPFGDYMQRVAHYFMEALVAKMSGTGEQLYTVITNNHPSAATMLKAFRQYVDRCPYIKVGHFFETKMTLDAFEGATRVHIIHYGIQYGVEWPTLIQHLSKRPEGPPHFRITGVDVPYPGEDPCWKIEQTGRRLAEFAKMWNVPFEFHALAGKWESFTARDFNLRSDEVLAVITHRLHNILDVSVLGASPRELLLRRIRSLNPKVFFMFVDNAACNGPFFMTRFRESVKHYSAIFNGMELSFPIDDPERVILEREIFGREILNIVACEGQARVERQEPYRQWQNRLQRAGFTRVHPKQILLSKMKAMMATFHKDYGVGVDDGWILLGIKNQVVRANSFWEPKPVMSFIS